MFLILMQKFILFMCTKVLIANQALETSGVISGRGTVSAVYTMPLEDTETMYSKISAMLIPEIIRDSGGFYETAKKLSSEPKSSMTFSMISRENSFLYQLKLSVSYPNSADIDIINPLEFLKTDSLQRSNYFANGILSAQFYFACCDFITRIN